MNIVPSILLVAAFLTMTACSTQTSTVTKSGEVATNEVKTTVSQTESSEDPTVQDEKSVEVVEEEQENKAITIKKGDKVTVDG
ncbi:hypothetical protein [Paenibacillus xylanexedens]|uniref:ABC-type glycerol-3-phosphate transport system substrate-binding protein n=1 Tax=Paenibacillus xylanexedens TaxID=528191 RepID=A0ABS4RLV0_PAEXY|nr:hypothetical protein [Paenibacillus xylanexedens]MBP2243871.1 ABC-type glycerol-3-phosphate transport system substrate-binding protein [Paenibacillus xylanexedens]